jgi:magnesium chelatase family protein
MPLGLTVVDDALRRGRLSERGFDKVLKLSWTVADLAGRDRPSAEDVALALAMRRGEQPGTTVRAVG